jgi:hypothetical protein
MTTTVVATILSDFSFQKNFLIRNACGIESLMAADIALILLWKKKRFSFENLLNKQIDLKFCAN